MLEQEAMLEVLQEQALQADTMIAALRTERRSMELLLLEYAELGFAEKGEAASRNSQQSGYSELVHYLATTIHSSGIQTFADSP